VRIFVATGRMVRRMDAGVLPTGGHELTRNGRDDAGNLVPAGIYFIRVRAGALDLSAKAVRLN